MKGDTQMTGTLLAHLTGIVRAIGPCLVVMAAMLGMWPGIAKGGGFYRVAECSSGHVATPDATVEGTTTSYSAATSCAGGNWLQVQSAAEARGGDAKQWVYTAPPGTQIKQFTGGYNLVGDPSPDGNRSYLFVRRAGQTNQENLSVVGLGSTAGTYDSSIQDPGPLAAVGVGVFCSRPSTPCGYAPGQFARLSRVDFLMEDIVPPGAPVIAGSAADGNWVAGTTQLAVGETDVGSGVDRTTVAVDGQQILSDRICQPNQDANGYVGRMAPCDPLELRNLTVDTRLPQFHEGSGNEVRVCTHEYGLAGASTCATKSFRVDNVPPSAPQNLAVVGGDGWHRDNDFELTWKNPVQQHAPIVAVTVEIMGPGGVVSTTTRATPNVGSIEGVKVPGVGEHRARVYLRDAAGNESPAASAEVVLKFDDTRPPMSRPEIANGWLSRSDLTKGYVQAWRRPALLDLPPAGVAGYRVAIDRNPASDPCANEMDPRTCGGPLTEVGIDRTSRTLGGSDLPEGSNWVHVVPVSGSGVRAAEVGRTELKVDLTDPVSRLSGASSGWVNHPVALRVDAMDDGSGMEDTEEFPEDDPPRTVVEVDGAVYEDGDADVGARVDGSGVHRVRFWARDLAGNENDGRNGNAEPGSAQVRIDLEPPAVAFADEQDPGDPDRLEAPVGDGLSGVAGGRISMRELGTLQWRPLQTELIGDSLLARADSATMRDGTVYEFKAEATDRAGNLATTTRRVDGSEMRQAGPFRATTRIVDLKVNGRPNARVAYGRTARVSGRLVDRSGAAVGGSDLTVRETYASGAKRSTRTIAARTSGAGAFAVTLPKGPSRTVEVRFAGDERRLGTTSATARLRAKGAIAMRAPRRVRAGGRAVFRGRVKGRGAEFTKRGKALEVQVRMGRRWKTVGRSTRTDPKGRFSLRYRFVASYTRPVRYRFRAVALRERGWPYLPARSRSRSLVVVP